MQCPYCHSHHIKTCGYGRNTGAAIGTVAGTVTGASGALGGAQVGASLGVIGGPIGSFAGALIGGLDYSPFAYEAYPPQTDSHATLTGIRSLIRVGTLVWALTFSVLYPR